MVSIDSTEISRSTAPTLSQLLQARRPGLRVLRSGGLVNDGALVMLRGPTSVLGANTPIVIVDGVRVDSRQFDQPLTLGAAAPSRLDDFLPEEIERIDVLSGPAAALYGDGAANGVILITTKPGSPGRLRLSSRVSWTTMQNSASYPANYKRVGTLPSTGQPVPDCSLAAVAGGTCTPTGLNVWNPLEQASPFRTGNSALGRLALAGSSLGTSVYAGVTARGRQGVLSHDGADRIAFRAKLARDLPGHFSLEASGGSLHEHARSAIDGDRYEAASVFANGLFGNAVDDANRGYGQILPADSIYPASRLRHNTGGVTVRWQPGRWLEASIMTGRDLVTEHWHEDHIGTGVPTSTLDHRDDERNDLRTSAASVRSAYRLGAAIDASTVLGLQRDVLQRAMFDSTGAPPVFGYNASWFHVRSTALWLTESMHLPWRIDAAASMERVTSGVFGPGAGKEWFPSVNASWSSTVTGHELSDIRFRAAYAEAPGASATVPVSLGTYNPPFGPPSTPPPPKMERTKQLELGAEARIGDLTSVSFTAFKDHSTRLWAIGPAQGFATAAQVAAMTNTGVEAIVDARLLDVHTVRWDGSFSLALLHNRVTTLPTPYSGTIRNRAVLGQPLGGIFEQNYTYADANHDGIIEASEVQLVNSTFAGPPLPTLESAFQSSLTLPGHIVLGALVDYRRGNQAVDETGRFRCSIANCRETQDPTAPLDRQAAAVASRLTNYSIAGYVSDASFMRLRELALRWTVPPAADRFLGVYAEVTVAGRNLATWTNYRGLDPEVSYQPPDVLLRQDLLMVPVPRELVVRLDVRP
jgi:TonB-dependent SusC/RagA subfamily outer membrane receptor